MIRWTSVNSNKGTSKRPLNQCEEMIPFSIISHSLGVVNKVSLVHCVMPHKYCCSSSISTCILEKKKNKNRIQTYRSITGNRAGYY